MQPSMACKGDEINSFLIYPGMNRHAGKILKSIERKMLL